MREVTLAATQMTCSKNNTENIDKAESIIRKAAEMGAQIILIQELFESTYFCMDQKDELFQLSKPFENHPTIEKFSELAKELNQNIKITLLKCSQSKKNINKAFLSKNLSPLNNAPKISSKKNY